jgi:hypothetical protein
VNGKATNDQGGAISNTGGGLTLTECTITNSAATGTTTTTGNGGGIYNAAGASLSLTRCTLNDNSAQEFGGGLYNDGAFTATNCTFSNNTALRGGGIISRFAGGAGSSLLRNCTITKCSATDGLSTAGSGGGGFYAEGGAQQHHVGNTIIAGNTSTNDADVRGQITSDGHNFVGNFGDSTGFMISGINGDQGAVGSGVADPKLDAILKNNGGPTDTHALTSTSSTINFGDDALAPPTDQRGYLRSGKSDMGAFEFNGPVPSNLANVSTRLPVGTGDNVLIEGFVVQGPAGSAKKIIVRAIGPSLADFGITDALPNPTLEIHDANNNNAIVASNDDWKVTQVGGIITADQFAEISASGFAPGNDVESAIIANLSPGSYTAVVRGVGNSVGTGVVDAYDLSTTSSAKLVNVATRGLIQPDDKLMIAGFITQNGSARAVVRAIGPSLAAFGITNALADTTLQLRDANGVIVIENDDWKIRSSDGGSQQAEIEATGLQPTDDREAAVVTTLPPGQYTAQVRGKPETTGTGVVQVYFLP